MKSKILILLNWSNYSQVYSLKMRVKELYVNGLFVWVFPFRRYT